MTGVFGRVSMILEFHVLPPTALWKEGVSWILSVWACLAWGAPFNS